METWVYSTQETVSKSCASGGHVYCNEVGGDDSIISDWETEMEI